MAHWIQLLLLAIAIMLWAIGTLVSDDFNGGQWIGKALLYVLAAIAVLVAVVWFLAGHAQAG